MSNKYNLLIKSKHVEDMSIFTCMNAYNKTNIFYRNFVLEKFQIVISYFDFCNIDFLSRVLYKIIYVEDLTGGPKI